MKELELLKRRLAREIRAKKEAENFAEKKTYELYTLNKELEKKSLKLDRAIREMQKFVSVTSHDLKAPIKAIGNLTSFIEKDQEQLSDSSIENLGLIKGRAKRLDKAIDALLEYAQADYSDAVKNVVVLKPFINAVIDLIQIPDGFEITFDSIPEKIFASREMLFKLFTLLIENSIKHFPENRANGIIAIGGEQKKGRIEFSVSDNGAGIAANHHHKIFDIFQVLKPRDNFESVGIGLAVSKKMVESVDGQVWVESTTGNGSAFHFTIITN